MTSNVTSPATRPYRGRIAPTPTGALHLGHAATFYRAFARAQENGGTLVYRNEDIDLQRCKPTFAQAAIEDLKWLGIHWQEGPDCGGPHAPYNQSERLTSYREAWQALANSGAIYPCSVSRKDLREAAGAPHEEDEAAEPIFPASLRPQSMPPTGNYQQPDGINWRFRVPDGETVEFHDQRCGHIAYTAGEHFGDFLVWRKDDTPAYELAVVADDIAMGITEVVRGEDLLKSTARQILLFRALGCPAHQIPDFLHTPLLRDESGRRLAKRHHSLSLATLRNTQVTPSEALARAGIQPI